MVPIFIPSKGKAIPGKTLTTDLLKSVREYTMFVEPEEVDAYRKLHEQVVSIEASGLKIGYARRYIQEYAHRNEVEASWILDDDIRALYRVPDRKDESCVNGGAAVLEEAEEAVTDVVLKEEPQVAAFHLDFYGNADRARDPKPFTYNKVPVMNVLALWERVRAAKAEYDPEIWIHEDVDFAFQLFRARYQTAQFNRFAFRAVPTETSAAHPDYLAMSLKMQGKHPGWCQIILRRNDKAWKKHLGV
jgi:hypothetical protein